MGAKVSKALHLDDLGHRLRSRSALVLIGLNLLMYFLLLRWVGENIHLEKLSEYFGKIPVWALLGSLVINFLALAMSGIRMALLLGRNFQTAFSIVNIGYALNTILPLRLGEGLKLYLSRRFFGVALTRIFAASIAEKLFDLGIILLLSAAALAMTAGEFIKVAAVVSVGVFVFAAVVGVALFRRYIVHIVKLLPRGSRLRRASIDLHKYAGDYPLGRIVLTTVGIWFLNVALVVFSFNAYGPDINIGILDAIALLVIIALAIAIPSAPAGIGLFEAGIVVYLTQNSGIDPNAALAAASAFHFIITLPQLILTVWMLWSPRLGRLAGGQ